MDSGSGSGSNDEITLFDSGSSDSDTDESGAERVAAEPEVDHTVQHSQALTARLQTAPAEMQQAQALIEQHGIGLGAADAAAVRQIQSVAADMTFENSRSSPTPS
eukprot:SAG22_NODE_2900_length_2115_cov_20.629464_2_plen_105_part_00